METDAVFGMEDMRQRLKMSMEVRKDEIEGRYRRQRKELKALQQEIHWMSLKKKRLYLHCEKLQAKYEALLRRTKFEPGDKRSPQLFIAKATREREAMQQEGYHLEQRVQEVQQEIQALEAAVEDVKEANELLRHSHRSPKMKGLADEQLQLKTELEQALQMLHERQRLEQSLLNDVTGLESSLQNLQSENSTVMECLKLLEEQVDIACKEAEEQNLKYKRAKAQLCRLAKEIKNSHGDELEKINKEMELAEFGETASDALYKLKTLASEFPDYGKIIEDGIVQAGITVPYAASSVRSGRSSVASMSSRPSSRSLMPRRALSSSGSARSSRSGSVLNLEFNSEGS
ncbi:hypothetical protein GOP47_0006230 [Adiantum capillus-veneris]|uniref:Uncharacterized protein n=2 Tax=Adiantum capillus-veneris TaxID=13818 RepID=A0A9D4V2V7_ADICA|nr:hypothetical protein GOP47_0006230 [Adiantum capillus-veneris]